MRLTAKLPLLLVGAMVATAIAGSVLAILVGRHVLRESALADSAQRVEIYASAIDYYVESARGVIIVTAQEPELAHAAGARRIAANILTASPVFEYVALLAPDGTVAMLEPRELEAQLSHRDLSFSVWFPIVRSREVTVVSDLHISPATQKPTVLIATPVRNADGRMTGIWAGALKLAAVSEIGATGRDNSRQIASGYVTDRRGLILAHQTQPRFVEQQTDFSSVASVRAALEGRNGTGEVFNPIEGEWTLSAYRALPELGWAVVHRVPSAAALAPVEDLTRGILASSLALTAIIGSAAAAFARRTVAPLAKLAAAARTLGTGDFSQHVEAHHSDEIGGLAMEFNRMAGALAQKDAEVRKRNTDLESANQELESFSYSVSHDLRVPLRAVDGYSRMLERKYGERLDDEARRLIATIRDGTQRMGQLIDDILAFSRMGRKEMAPKMLDMARLARAAAEELAPSRAGRAIDMQIAALPAAQGDAAMLHQVWINLIGNAIKFTRMKPAATIEVGGFREADENVYFVKDDGVGFDMQYAHKLFGVFQRLHGVQEFEGTGIGLAIVKRVVARHGGRVWADGKVNEGASFYFALPKEEFRDD